MTRYVKFVEDRWSSKSQEDRWSSKSKIEGENVAVPLADPKEQEKSYSEQPGSSEGTTLLQPLNLPVQPES